MTAQAPSLRYRPEIDGLRAMAVLAVLIAHAGYATGVPLLAGGFIGVDIFFVISGYLISRIIFEAGEDFHFGTFLARRVRRLFPPLLIVIVATLGLGGVFLTAGETRQLAQHVIASLFYLQNVNLWLEAGYFDAASLAKPLLHLWTLSVEEQFYLLYPPLLFALTRYRGARAVALAIGAAALLSLAAAQYGTLHYPDAAFYLLPTRAWELLGGALLAVIESRQGPSHRPSGLLAALGLAMMIMASWLFDRTTPHPSLLTLLPVGGAMLVIRYAGGSDPVTRLLSARLATGIGRISYGLYLWHWPLFVFAHILYGGPVPWQVIFVLALVATALSWLSYRFVERPVRSQGGRRAVISLLALSAGLMASSAGIFAAQSVWPGSFAQRTKIFSAQMEGPLWNLKQNDICLQQHGLPAAKDWAWFFCMKSDRRPPQVLLLGTSYANGYYPALTHSRAFTGKTVLSWGTCDIAATAYVINWTDPLHPCLLPRAALQARAIDAMLLKSESIETIVVVADHLDQQAYADAFAARLQEFRVLTKGRAALVVILPHYIPAQAFDTAACLSRPLVKINPRCSATAAEKTAFDARFVPLRATLARELPDVTIIDPNPVYCGKDGCHFLLADGLPVYRDPSFHLSRRAAGLFASRLDAELKALAKEYRPGIVESR